MKTKSNEDSARTFTYAFIGIAVMIVIALLTGCGSKKTITQSERKEKTDIELTDHSKINTKVEQKTQYVNTNAKERIVTIYGFQMVPVPVDGDTVYIPVSYPLQKDEDREISIQSLAEIISRQDSIQNAIDLKYQNDLKEKDKRISELKETRIYYHIALLIFGIGFMLIVIILIRKR